MWIQALDLCVFDLGDFARLRSVFNLFFFFGGGGSRKEENDKVLRLGLQCVLSVGLCLNSLEKVVRTSPTTEGNEAVLTQGNVVLRGFNTVPFVQQVN